MTTVSHLECSLCSRQHAAGQVHNLCACGGPLLVRYDLAKAKQSWNRAWIPNGPTSMWRYAPVLPVKKPEAIVSLGEGFTPMIRARRLGSQLGTGELWIKDEGLNPTGTFKARGSSCAISMAVELGLRRVVIPSAGNAASSLACYAAAAGLEAHVYIPRHAPRANIQECQAYGAKVTLVDGLISDCGRMASEQAKTGEWFEVSTFKEPYRLEGKKTLGYEIAEQFRWVLPDAILYPTGGGVGLIGMWKAFEEMETLGWISAKRPKMIAVQAEGCQPVVRAFRSGETRARFWEDAHTLATGLCVPKPLADFLILDTLRASGGTALAVSDTETMEAARQLASAEGLFAAPEGAACVAGLSKLMAEGFLSPEERIVICNTGCGLKYQEAYSMSYGLPASGEEAKLGGLITPR